MSKNEFAGAGVNRVLRLDRQRGQRVALHNHPRVKDSLLVRPVIINTKTNIFCALIFRSLV